MLCHISISYVSLNVKLTYVALASVRLPTTVCIILCSQFVHNIVTCILQFFTSGIIMVEAVAYCARYIQYLISLC